MAKDRDGLSPEEIEFRDQIAEETTPESMTRALRRRADMLDNTSTKERQRRLELERHYSEIHTIDTRNRHGGGLGTPNDARSMQQHIQSATKIEAEFAEGGYWGNYRKERAEADLIKSTSTFVGQRSTETQIYRAAQSVSSLGAITRATRGKSSTQLEKEITSEKDDLVNIKKKYVI